MSEPAEILGWELMHNSVRSSITKNADYVVAFAHWFLVNRAKFGCLGNGNDVSDCAQTVWYFPVMCNCTFCPTS